MALRLQLILLFTIGCLSFIFAHNHNCNHTLRELAHFQSEFVQCTVGHSTPAKSCVSCVREHRNMTVLYDFLVCNCSDNFLNKNRLNIVYNMQKMLVEIWNKGFCDDCFEGDKPNNSTYEFNHLKILFEDCKQNTEKDQICAICKTSYADLNDFYRKMDEEKEGKICFDIQDAMNLTRSTWSKDLKCCQRQYNLTLFIVGSSIFGVIPLIFYFGMYGYTKRLERNHEVIDSTFNSGNQVIASTSAGLSSGIRQRQPETAATTSAAEDIDELQNQLRDSAAGYSTSSQQNDNDRLIVL